MASQGRSKRPTLASLFPESLCLSMAPSCRLDLAPDSAVCDPWWVSKGGKGLELMRKKAEGAEGGVSCTVTAVRPSLSGRGGGALRCL